MENPLIIQAYFLTISNYSPTDQRPGPSRITLRFYNNGRIETPPLGFLDRITSQKVEISRESEYCLRADYDLGVGDTSVFLLQPNIGAALSKKPLFTVPAGEFDKKYDMDMRNELRGYVTIEASPNTQLLLSPQTRGTFYRGFMDRAVAKSHFRTMKDMPVTKSGSDPTAPATLTVVSEELSNLPTAKNGLYIF